MQPHCVAQRSHVAFDLSFINVFACKEPIWWSPNFTIGDLLAPSKCKRNLPILFFRRLANERFGSGRRKASGGWLGKEMEEKTPFRANLWFSNCRPIEETTRDISDDKQNSFRGQIERVSVENRNQTANQLAAPIMRTDVDWFNCRHYRWFRAKGWIEPKTITVGGWVAGERPNAFQSVSRMFATHVHQTTHTCRSAYLCMFSQKAIARFLINRFQSNHCRIFLIDFLFPLSQQFFPKISNKNNCCPTTCWQSLRQITTPEVICHWLNWTHIISLTSIRRDVNSPNPCSKEISFYRQVCRMLSCTVHMCHFLNTTQFLSIKNSVNKGFSVSLDDKRIGSWGEDRWLACSATRRRWHADEWHTKQLRWKLFLSSSLPVWRQRVVAAESQVCLLRRQSSSAG